IADHTAAQAKLAATAAQVGIQAPDPAPDADQQATIDRLEGLSDDAFDAAYLDAQVPAHEQAIALFTGFASDDANPRPLRVLAITTLPVLGSHLGQVQAAMEDHGGH